MKTMLILAILLVSGNSHASFNRFWVGDKKKEVKTADFLNGLNKTFFKDTIVVGSGRGLLSYQPYVTSMDNDVPDELALVSYESEEKYKAIRSTPEGERYSALHWDYFQKDTSKSTVTEAFKGDLEEGKAYELNSAFTQWQKGYTTVVIYAHTPDMDLKNLAREFSDLKLKKEINNSALLITKKWIFEYRSVKSFNTPFKKLPLKIRELKVLPSSELRQDLSVGFREGINFRF